MARCPRPPAPEMTIHSPALASDALMPLQVVTPAQMRGAACLAPRRPGRGRRNSGRRECIRRSRRSWCSRRTAPRRKPSPTPSSNTRNDHTPSKARHSNPVALLDDGDARSHGGDQADALMARDERGRRGLHRPVAVSGVEIGGADAARFGLDEDLTGTGGSGCRSRGTREVFRTQRRRRRASCPPLFNLPILAGFVVCGSD